MMLLPPLLWRHYPRYYDVTNPATMTILLPRFPNRVKFKEMPTAIKDKNSLYTYAYIFIYLGWETERERSGEKGRGGEGRGGGGSEWERSGEKGRGGLPDPNVFVGDVIVVMS